MSVALDGITGTAAVHICFGYAAVVHARPSGNSFLSELRGCGCKQVSIETAQSGLDCSVLAQLDDKQIMIGCIDLSDMAIETPEVVAARIRRALPFVAKERVILAPDCGTKSLPREVAVGKLQANASRADVAFGVRGGARDPSARVCEGSCDGGSAGDPKAKFTLTTTGRPQRLDRA